MAGRLAYLGGSLFPTTPYLMNPRVQRRRVGIAKTHELRELANTISSFNSGGVVISALLVAPLFLNTKWRKLCYVSHVYY